MGGHMIKRITFGLLGLVAVAVGSVLIAGYLWSRTEHGTLDYKAAIALKLYDALADDGPLIPAKMREAADARMRMLQGGSVAIARVEDREIPGPAGGIPIRVYWPGQGGPFPVLLFYHGGGWVIGNLDTNDELCRMLSRGASAVVVSVGYRLAPEHRFPAAVEDCYAALEWVHLNADALDVDRSRIAVGGASAGGNLAAVVALMARDRAGPELAYQLMFYPATNLFELNTASHRHFADGYGLAADHVEFFRDCYLPQLADRENPYASPLLADSLADLPPAMVITAGFDVLRDEGIAYAEGLEAAGVEAAHLHYPTMIHGFVAMTRLFDEGRDAIQRATDGLSEAFGE
jgi:acetyl esterase